jgi:hypothetical protein
MFVFFRFRMGFGNERRGDNGEGKENTTESS